MSDRLEVSAKVEAAVNHLDNVTGNVVSIEDSNEGEFNLTLSISSAVEEGDDEATKQSDDESPSNSSAVEEGTDDEADDDTSPSNSSAVEEGEDEDDQSSSSNSSAVEVEEGKFRCPLCGDYEGSKAQVDGHKGHCDGSPSNSSAVDEGTEDDENDTSSSNSSAVDKEEVPHPEDLSKSEREAKHFKAHYGVCKEEGCDYGASSEDEDFCASHRGSSANSSAVDKSYDDLTKGQQKAAQDLLKENSDDDSFELKDAVQMV